MIVSIIAAVAENNVIGKDNDLIWRLPDDMAFFKEKTASHCVLMGRRNFHSIPERFRPLPRRSNIVVSRSRYEDGENLYFVTSIEEGIDKARQLGEEELFIIGGGEIYRQSMPLADKIYLTRVHGEFEGDTFFPELKLDQWTELNRRFHDTDEKHAYAMTFLEYAKK